MRAAHSGNDSCSHDIPPRYSSSPREENYCSLFFGVRCDCDANGAGREARFRGANAKGVGAKSEKRKAPGDRPGAFY